MVDILKFLAKAALSAVVGKTFLALLRAFDVNPDVWVAQFVTRLQAPDPIVVAAIGWAIVAVFATAFYFSIGIIWHRAFGTPRQSDLTPAISPAPAMAGPTPSRLGLHFDAKDPKCFGEYAPGGGRFAHVFTHNYANVSIAGCRVDVEEIQAADAQGNPFPVLWHVRLPLSSCTIHDVIDPRKYEPFSLPPGSRSDAVDAISADFLGGLGQDRLRVHVHPHHNRGLFKQAGTYRLLLHLHSPSDSTRAWLVVQWSGIAQDVKVHLEPAD